MSLFNDARRAEWDEFVADCAKFDAEIDKELAANKLTLAELEEEEQSLERLRRWYRELKTRDVFGSQHAAEAEQRLKNCVERLEDYTAAGLRRRPPDVTGRRNAGLDRFRRDRGRRTFRELGALGRPSPSPTAGTT